MTCYSVYCKLCTFNKYVANILYIAYIWYQYSTILSISGERLNDGKL